MLRNKSQLPSIYVICLAASHAGYQHGCWIEATQNINTIKKAIQKMLLESPIENAKVWAIHDYSGFDTWVIRKFEDLESIHKKALFIQEYGNLAAPALGFFGDIDAAKEAFNERYQGAFENKLAFSTKLFHKLHGSFPDVVKCYINYDKFCADMFSGNYVAFESHGMTHIFSCY